MKQIKHVSNVSRHFNSASDSPKAPIRLIADNIRSLHNVGAMFRTTDSINGEHIHLCGICGTPPRKEIKKTALETVKTVPWTYHEETTYAIKTLKEAGYTIYALELCDISVPYDDISYTFPCALVVGHEINGISEEVLSHCDRSIHIPMNGIGVSLNVATAAGIALVHLRREWDRNGMWRSKQ